MNILPAILHFRIFMAFHHKRVTTGKRLSYQILAEILAVIAVDRMTIFRANMTARHEALASFLASSFRRELADFKHLLKKKIDYRFLAHFGTLYK